MPTKDKEHRSGSLFLLQPFLFLNIFKFSITSKTHQNCCLTSSLTVMIKKVFCDIESRAWIMESGICGKSFDGRVGGPLGSSPPYLGLYGEKLSSTEHSLYHPPLPSCLAIINLRLIHLCIFLVFLCIFR
ncbi:hypothetical protein GTNG_3089 [Geobacillus thermodenitrificans NG80-2]|uniref:Uncharacterized protein n=1 Tax=Geobacillus thermodenitrificans (strain NG80-2) TaxID=420246 RepID=A4ISY0_GEOTN|nr:hypothetical protein GTNG_3089 [Geobacillus thermodenitrificans NG80-2]